MKTKPIIKLTHNGQNGTISGQINKSTRTSITIKFPQKYIDEYWNGIVAERIPTQDNSQNRVKMASSPNNAATSTMEASSTKTEKRLRSRSRSRSRTTQLSLP